MDSRILCSFYRCTIESILTGCITAWYSSCTALNRKALQRVVKAAQHITRTELPSMEDLYTQRCRKKATKIIKDPSHPSYKLFCLLPSGRRFHAAFEPEPQGFRDSFIPQAIRLLNYMQWDGMEAMVLDDRKRVACPLQVGGEVLPQVEEFKYLGVLFTSEGKMEREIDRRIGAASCSYAVGVPDHRGEEGAKSKGEALDLPVNLRSHPYLWS
ncbi:hypothetical protein L3Q82_022332 [Scortum barcoo]|uniref:Uncharacterized protein n=1 Tax=Scortum barcoo TaxID=214431 RepID=A0ACB8X1K9_9TELE|nr:hypothetical protein L3Q82_022332 [Scortum barcoo]